ncbi:MAG: NUDIX hydrolase [Patescibacteria group bacterium]
MNFQIWKRVSTETVSKNPIWEYRQDHIRAEDGSERDYYYVRTGGGVCVFPINRNGKVALVRQYRYLFDRVSLEPAGGQCNPELSFADSARAELEQETGLNAEYIERIGSIAPWAAVSDEEMHVFVAYGLSSAYATPDEYEECMVVEMTPEEIEGAIERGEMFNGFAIAACVIAKPHLLSIIDQEQAKR